MVTLPGGVDVPFARMRRSIGDIHT
jgi:hypothetical protein